jgi:hypothetical protein
VAATVVLAGCGSTGADPHSPHPATLHVRQEWVSGGLYVEGSYSYVRLEQGERRVVQVRLSDERIPRATIRLDPGMYRLVSFQRPCDGNCGTLDPPTDKCSRALDVKADAELHTLVQLTPGKGCTIEEEQKID